MFTIITQIRNEEKRLKDWLDYHKDLGVSEFIIYLDNCDDESEVVLNSMKNSHNILIQYARTFGTYTKSENPYDYKFTNTCDRIQDSYKRGLDYVRKKYNEPCHWSIFTEVDEYIVPQKNINLFDIVKMKDVENFNRIYIASYDFKCPFDLNIPVYNQTYMRWSDDIRKNGVSNGVSGWFCNRGKSMVRTINCVTEKVAIHEIDNSPYYQNDELLKINHYRNFGEMPIYDYYDDKILNWIKNN